MLNSSPLVASFRDSSLAYFSDNQLGLFFSFLDLCKLKVLNIFSISQFIALIGI